jgi:hypothetical protein
MTARAWLTGELGSAAVFAVPTVVFTMAGAQHVAVHGEPWVLYVLSSVWFWGPAPLLAAAVLFQARARSVRMGWGMSVLAAVAMSLLSGFVLWRFSREGDIHWSLWAMWIAAALGALLTIAGTVALAPSRRLSGGCGAISRVACRELENNKMQQTNVGQAVDLRS